MESIVAAWNDMVRFLCVLFAIYLALCSCVNYTGVISGHSQ
jgi:hypothetical protein